MKRRLCTILSALSLVLCLTCVGMWVRSYFSIDTMYKEHGDGHQWRVTSDFGRLTLSTANWTPSIPGVRPTSWIWEARPQTSSFMGRLENTSLHEAMRHRASRWSFLAVAWEWQWPDHRIETVRMGGSPHVNLEHQLRLPYWLLILSATVLPGLWGCGWLWRRWKATHRHKAGLCRVCGYDLRASPERCPECGTAVPSSATPPASSPSDPV